MGSRSELDEVVLASIKLQRYDELNDCYGCGCQQRGTRWFLCSYHEGYGDGFDAAVDSGAAASSTADTETPK